MFDKITSRISKLCYGLNKEFIEPVSYPTHTPIVYHSQLAASPQAMYPGDWMVLLSLQCLYWFLGKGLSKNVA